MRLTRQGSPQGVWLLTKAARHLCDTHPECAYARQVTAAATTQQSSRLLQQLNFSSPASMGELPKVGQQPLPSSFVLSKEKQELSAKARHCCQKWP